MAEIHLKNISHSYMPNPQGPTDYALKALDHVWQDGGAYALLGPSGCGKTTLLNIISGLLTPSKGAVMFGDQDITARDTAHRNIAQVFQFPVIYDTMTVRQNLAFPLRNRGVPAAEVNARVDEVADLLGIADRLGDKAAGLTADAKQIISLGRGLVRQDVNAILFDEPLTVIDPHLKWQLRSKLKALHQQFGFTMIYVTHDQTEALTFADKVVVMNDGEVLQIGTPEELFEKPTHTFVGYFIGSPGMNFLEADVEGKQATIAGQSIDLAAKYTDMQNGKIEVGIRPEFLSLHDPDHQTSTGIRVTVQTVEDLGRHRVVKVDANGTMVTVVVQEGGSIPSGSATLEFDPSRTLVYQNSRLVEGAS